MPDRHAPDLTEAEAWFVDHGLPYFVDDIRAQVHRGLSRHRLALVLLVAVLLASAVVAGFGLAGRGWGTGVVPGLNLGLLSILLYALVTLRAGVIARWAARRTFSSLGLLFPLVTRALPLLLLFVTFLFINAEVWEVSATLEGSVMWLTVTMFLTITIGFLLVRLPEELAVFDEQIDPDQIARHVEGTPLAPFHSDEGGAPDVAIGGLQKANLVLMLLITQLVQVVLLSLTVFAFFVAFGLLIMDPEVIRGWTGEERLTNLSFFERANWELVQVSVFLAAFSGFYFTVYAVTDNNYRNQFFTKIMRELARVVGARICYRELRRRTDT